MKQSQAAVSTGMTTQALEALAKREYKWGFVSDIEADSLPPGLNEDVIRAINRLRRPDNAMILVTHYQRILQSVEPDRVHVLFDGRIVKSGGTDLALMLEREGYDLIREQLTAGQPATP